MVKEGVLVSWNDDKGFGFVETAQNERYFLHIKAIKRTVAGRPKNGDLVVFEPGCDANGRLQALTATVGAGSGRAQARQKLPERRGGGGFDVFDYALIPLLLVLPVAVWHSGLSLQVTGLVLVASALAFAMYQHDKSQARSGGWRTPESTLQLLALAGGWPGAWAAQHLLRHKSSKASFRAVFVCAAIANLALLWSLPRFVN
ncbi:DUF1294 domain-containing protein [Jeongeupia sp. USM3]|uniref:DUF1294 domain-containing protein n=1 Tax=Jeongeupia sp. USM3 TaxID=1906741 RepID=UPI00089DFC96|nr:DUF1294 domain-containing protein [Jeongeupia sp. USM3]AOY01172.1 hypothetical protein BJP62_12400 [Jeongeupia sp. USM3]